ncbi:MAG: methyl-accepting chemotaxis protein [Pseudomonadota bacterium]
MLAKQPIKTRVNLGFGMVVAFLIGVAAFGFVAVSKLGATFGDYRESSQKTVLINEYVEDMFKAQAAALEYRFNPTPETAAEVISNIEEITMDRRLIERSSVDAETKAEIEELTILADEYAEAFGKTVALQKRRDDLVDVIVDTGPRIRLALTEIMETAYRDGDVEAGYFAGIAQQEMMLARFYMERFLFTNDSSAFDRVEKHLAVASGQMFILLPRLQDERRKELAQSVLAYHKLYEKSGQEAYEIIGERNSIRVNVLDRIGPELTDRYEVVIDTAIVQRDELGSSGAEIVTQMTWWMPAVGAFAAILALFAARSIGGSISRPIGELADRTTKLAAGDLDVEIEGAEHQHEIGEMARALDVFRDGELKRREKEAEERAIAQETALFVEQLSKALKDIADGDLTVSIPAHESPRFQGLCSDFNQSVERLRGILSGVIDTAQQVSGGMTSVASAAEKLARRTEQQAAALTETSAAMSQIETDIGGAAQNSLGAQTLVQNARERAEAGQTVVTKSVAAMGEIKSGSQEISQITNVIDDIAFQTNLLALNAGVEAARAGDAGRGFAIVAAEVRGLAQRASDAAQDIKALIDKSETQVNAGADLANDANKVLSEIMEMVAEVSGSVSSISAAAQNQAQSIKEVNSAMSELDSLTQQNAAMVEETTAATVELRSDVASMAAGASVFRVDAAGVETSIGRAAAPEEPMRAAG